VNKLEISFGTPLRLIVEQAQPATIVPRLKIKSGPLILETGGPFVFTMPIDYYIDLQVSYVDQGGNPAAVDGDVTWTSSDESIVLVSVDDSNSMKCRMTSLGKTGQVQISATADADLGSGVTELVTLMDVSIVAGEAVAGTITPFGTAQPVP
jgi:hypothetical protein